MFVMDFRHSPKRAFFHGFLKGLAAPAMLFYQEDVSDIHEFFKDHEVPTFSKHSAIGALAEDFSKIGGDISVVIKRYEQDRS